MSKLGKVDWGQKMRFFKRWSLMTDADTGVQRAEREGGVQGKGGLGLCPVQNPRTLDPSPAPVSPVTKQVMCECQNPPALGP